MFVSFGNGSLHKNRPIHRNRLKIMLNRSHKPRGDLPWRFILCGTIKSLFITAILLIKLAIEGRVVRGSVDQDQVV